ncbi:thiamine pyrophosphate-requiring protein [Streptomyces sp. Y2F8-2]|uniref:thiamine pyrophosphate-dependent enzyme n=1 Tax=unclassified Streptomyces TaxID=2593676 RepID=UPI001903B0FA|nr:thiamine pyrophosphate-dependent enzyme [Streptomyces sp. Y2F8-2]GHK04998.1 thiamine pyrophosphate-requiring protein [Streptomyces sp. Y2F8-2]
MAVVSEVVRERLRAWGVVRVYGYPGQGADPLLEAFRRAGREPEFVQARHGEAASFMACGHARFTDTVGCCLAPSGPGAVQILNGLYDAQLDRQPVVALLGDTPRTGPGARRPQAVHLDRLCADVSESCEVVISPDQAGPVLDRAFRTASARRGVAVVILPADVLDQQAPPSAEGAVPPDVLALGGGRPLLMPEEGELRRAAGILAEGRKVAMVIGRGAARAGAEVERAAELLGAGVAKALLALDVLPDDLGYVTGPAGRVASPASERLVRACDTLLLVGAGPREAWLPPGRWAVRSVEINPEAGVTAPCRPGDVRLVGDPKATLEALLPLLHHKKNRAWRRSVEKSVRTWHRNRRAEARQHFGHLINPAAVATELSDRLPDRALLTADAGSSTVWWARHLRLRAGMRAALSGHHAAMGTAVPYALAARFAHPDRPVIAFVGDGAFQMSGMAEMITVKDHLERLSGGPPLVFCVFNNRDLNQATWDRRAQTGNPRLSGTSSVPDVPYAAYARLLGLEGVHCYRPKDIGAAWDAALAARRPVVVEFVVDAETEPPRPAGFAEQGARRRIRALLRGRRT